MPVVLVLLGVLTSCSSAFDNEVCEAIGKGMQNRDSCIFRLDAITRFKWDTLHVFSGPTTSEFIAEDYGIKPRTEKLSEYEALYVFTNNGDIVKEEVFWPRANICVIAGERRHEILLPNRIYHAYKLYAEEKPNDYRIFVPLK